MYVYVCVQDDTNLVKDDRFHMIQKGFKVVEKAFHDMDADNGGSIDFAEMKQALFATASDGNMEIMEKRFKELDFNGDGDIELPEFLYGMVSWVGFTDEDEHEDEPAADA